MLGKLFVEWPKFSGNTAYPIGWLARVSATLWDRNTEYGQLRWELLEWLIKELQK